MSRISRENKDYLIKGTELICDKGEYENKFEVSDKSVKLQGHIIANQADNVAGTHIKSFGSCSVMGTCKMETDLKDEFLLWFETYPKVIICGSKALLEDSYCFCPYGGKITIFNSKQVDYDSAMKELFGEDFAEKIQQMADSLAGSQQLVVKSLILMFDGVMTEYFEKEEERLKNEVVNMIQNNTANSYMYLQSGHDPVGDLAVLQRSKREYEQNNWQNIKDVNLNDVYKKMQENPNKVELGPRKIPKEMMLLNPVFIAAYFVETRVRNIRSELPNMTIGDFFRRGTSKEGITELWEKGMDSQNKKMLPGMLGYHPLQAAFTSGYTYYNPQESMEIVNSMSDDAKASYLLRKETIDGMTAYNELYGYYQMAKALDMSTKGKVKTGVNLAIENSFLDEELNEIVKKNKKVATVEELVDMMNERKNVKASFADDEMLRYYKAVEVEGSHWIDENGVSNIVLRQDVSSRRTVFHEWLHKYLQRKHGVGNIPNEEWYIENFLERHKEVLKID